METSLGSSNAFHLAHTSKPADQISLFSSPSIQSSMNLTYSILIHYYLNQIPIFIRSYNIVKEESNNISLAQMLDWVYRQTTFPSSAFPLLLGNGPSQPSPVQRQLKRPESHPVRSSKPARSVSHRIACSMQEH